MKKAGKYISFMVVLFVGGLYTAFVAQQFWDWFVTSAFHLSEISFWVMYGLVMFIGLFTDHGENPAEELKWKTLMIAVQACIPEHRAEQVKEDVKLEADDIWINIFSLAFGKLVGNSLALALGWTVHTFLV